MHDKILTILEKADHLASSVRSVHGDRRQGLAVDAEERTAASRDDLQAAINQLTREEWEEHQQTVERARELAEQGDGEAIGRMLIVGELENARPSELPTLITQALEAGVPVEDVAVASGLPLERVRQHGLDALAGLSPALREVLETDTRIVVLERELDGLKARRAEAARRATGEGESWYRVAKLTGRQQSTVERWK